MTTVAVDQSSTPEEALPGPNGHADGMAPFLVSIRRHLHMHPEIGLHEFETSAFIKEVLAMNDLDVVAPLATTGLYVDIPGEHPGPTVAYRADIDALPIQDLKTTDYRSHHDGLAHLCGHDVHTTVALGVALLLSKMQSAIHGTVRVFFQPNEEGLPSGAPLMIEDGVLDNVEAAYCIHVDPTLKSGRFGLIVGPATAAVDRFSVFVRDNSTGHSARPHEGTDTVWLATLIAQTLYQHIGRITDARNNAIMTICRFFGGEAYNVIPMEAEFGGTLRSTNLDDHEFLKDYIVKTADKLGELYGAETEVVFDMGAPPVDNHPDLIKNVARTIRETYGQDAIYDIPRPSMGSEDFAHYLRYIPGALIRVGTAHDATTRYPLHDAHFDIDESTIAPTVNLITRVLINHLRRGVLK